MSSGVGDGTGVWTIVAWALFGALSLARSKRDPSCNLHGRTVIEGFPGQWTIRPPDHGAPICCLPLCF